MTNKLGFYLHSFEIGSYKENLFRAIQEVKPPVMLVHAWNQVDQLRRLSPDSFIIGRMEYFGPDKRPIQHLTDSWLDDTNPRARGRDFAEHILRDNFEAAQRRENGRLLVDAWMSLNEAVPGPASDRYRQDPIEVERRLRAYDLFQAGFRERLIEQGIEAVAFNFGAGNFAAPEHYGRFFPHTLSSYRYLGFHEYGWPALSTTVNATAASSAGTYRPIVRELSRRFDRAYEVIITEAGLTLMHKYPNRGDLGNLDKGWLVEPPAELGAQPVTQQDYWQSLRWYNEFLRADDFVLGACLFEVGHAGDWETFRHFGQDREGAEIAVIERVRELAALPEGAALGAARPAPSYVTLRGRIENGAGLPVPGALVRLVGGEQELGDDPRAVIVSPGAVSWTRSVRPTATTSLWGFWQRYVSRNVAGITWEEFRARAARYNPSLRWTDDSFIAGESYIVPENRFDPPGPPAPEIMWDRPLAGFEGTLWGCWQRYIQGKVIGMTWERFRVEVLAENPELAADGSRLRRERAYVLPRNAGPASYCRVAFTLANGRVAFKKLRPGVYRLEVSAQDYRHLEQPIAVTDNQSVILTLESLALAVEFSGLESFDPFVRVIGRHFVLGGQSMRFIGVNLRGLVHYGSETLPHAQAHEQLSTARDLGARVVRVFLPNARVSVEETRTRLAALIEMMKRDFPGMYLVVALSNLYSDVDFRVPGDDAFYTLQPPGESRKLLGVEWFRDGFRQNYLPFVELIVDAFKGEPTILAYNIGNELKAQDDPELLIRFMHTMARRIRELAPRQLVSTGMISTRHAFMAGREDLRRALYNTDLLHFITNHTYHIHGNDVPSPEDDSDLAAALGKPLLVEEAGFEAFDDRSELYAREVRDLFGRGTVGYMPWGVMSGSFDTGDGDRALGLDRIWHGADWDRLVAHFREWADRLSAEAVGIDAPPAPAPPSRPSPMPSPGGRPAPPRPAPPRPPTSPSDFTVGQRVFAVPGLRVRRPAGLKGAIAFQTRSRTPVIVTGAFQLKDNLRWWPVRIPLPDGRTLEGWMAQTSPGGEVLLTAT